MARSRDRDEPLAWRSRLLGVGIVVGAAAALSLAGLLLAWLVQWTLT